MSDAADLNTPPRQPPPSIRWQSWPVRDEPVRSAVIGGGLLIAVVTVYWLTGRIYLAAAALAALMISLWRFFLPAVHELSDAGVDRWLFGRQRRIPWQAVGGYEICSAGVLLLPHKDRSAMAALGSRYLPFSIHRDEILANVHYYLDPPEASSHASEDTPAPVT